MSNGSPTAYLLWAILSCLYLVFLLLHLWNYDRFACLRWDAGRQPGAFKRVMTYSYLATVPLLVIFSVAITVFKFKEGFLVAQDGSIQPLPFSMWSTPSRRWVLPLYFVLSVAWSLEHVTHLEELTFWLFLLTQNPNKREWFESWEFRVWSFGSVSTVAGMPTTALATRYDIDTCLAYIFLVGSAAGTTTTICFLYVLARFPSFVAYVKAEGAEPDVVVRLATFYQLNRIRVVFRFLFTIPLMLIAIDALRPGVSHPIINDACVLVPFLVSIGVMGLLIRFFGIMQIFFPRSITRESGYRTKTPTQSNSHSHSLGNTREREDGHDNDHDHDHDLQHELQQHELPVYSHSHAHAHARPYTHPYPYPFASPGGDQYAYQHAPRGSPSGKHGSGSGSGYGYGYGHGGYDRRSPTPTPSRRGRGRGHQDQDQDQGREEEEEFYAYASESAEAEAANGGDTVEDGSLKSPTSGEGEGGYDPDDDQDQDQDQDQFPDPDPDSELGRGRAGTPMQMQMQMHRLAKMSSEDTVWDRTGGGGGYGHHGAGAGAGAGAGMGWARHAQESEGPELVVRRSPELLKRRLSISEEAQAQAHTIASGGEEARAGLGAVPSTLPIPIPLSPLHAPLQSQSPTPLDTQKLPQSQPRQHPHPTHAHPPPAHPPAHIPTSSSRHLHPHTHPYPKPTAATHSHTHTSAKSRPSGSNTTTKRRRHHSGGPFFFDRSGRLVGPSSAIREDDDDDDSSIYGDGDGDVDGDGDGDGPSTGTAMGMGADPESAVVLERVLERRRVRQVQRARQVQLRLQRQRERGRERGRGRDDGGGEGLHPYVLNWTSPIDLHDGSDRGKEWSARWRAAERERERERELGFGFGFESGGV
ncbi:hypothetical protein H0H92_015476 [Tricholoma furcatifolium]|nr:hypothetical protein H0H92_015476 [Tricholoma furcatifolium]